MSYVIYIEGASAPKEIHSSFYNTEQEAIRLMNTTGKKFSFVN